MYVPERFKSQNSETITQIINEYNFATLISDNEFGPIISHIPMIYDDSQGLHGKLIGHVAISNLHWKHFETAKYHLVIFHGPNAYISPRWYEPAPDNVPTWNYAVVHAYGQPKVCLPEDAWTLMQRMVKHFDPDVSIELNEVREKLLKGIIVFEMPIEKLEAKFKLSQNRMAKDSENVIENLMRSELEIERVTGQLMKKFSRAED